MVFPSCSLWILVARTDIPFMMHTIPHLVRMSNFPFKERVLAIDTAPLSGDKLQRPGIGTMAQLRDCVHQLWQTGIVDRVVDINYDLAYQNRVYQKHFGSRIWQTHNYKGYPILGTIFTIEEAEADYFLHFDSDMLLYQHPDYSWVEAGIKFMEKYPEIITIRPLTGPPAENGILHQSVPYEKADAGFYKFKFFGSRVYLINRKRFDDLLPLPIIWRSYRQKFMEKLPLSWQTTLNYLTKKGKLDSWEIMVSKKLEQTNYFRAVLDNPLAWTLHPKDRSDRFLQALPTIIDKIESGYYPPEQAGDYEFQSNLWL
jgi:hypothetical protein